MGKKWTPEEIEVLERVYPVSGSKGVQALLVDRSLISIIHKANRLMLFRENSWTSEEELILKETYSSEGVNGCLIKLPEKTKYAIIGKVNSLKLKRKRVLIDLTNRRFGKLLVIERGQYYVSSKEHREPQWECVCDCGRATLVRGNSLRRGTTKSCGHCNDIIIGKIYNKYVEPLYETTPYTSPKSGKHTSRFRVKCHYNGPGCKQYFITSGESLKKGLVGSCGCLQREQIINLGLSNKGSNNPAWKGGISSFSVEVRNLSEYTIWHRLVFERDNYTCQYSGLISGSLEAHHIKPLWLIIEENKIITLEQARRCEELWDVDNGITLNRKYHKEFHRIFKHSYTTEDFYMWLNDKLERKII